MYSWWITTKAVWVAMIVVFVSVMFLSLLHMPAGAGMSGMSLDCPFMSHEETICPMNMLDHLAAWKAVFVAVVPSFVLLLVLIVAVATMLVYAPHLWQRQKYKTLILPQHIRERTYTFAYRPLQELFSNGILHPKLF